ncbi:serine/threonine-protein phosphatase 2A regulatory subunit B'' subunit delta isoform X2 [Culicoides brevitarsis]|uniref:serine/threonine-protein phosphatase 2A regulatory subunit B'' subunit delta isoform X2 n=1 Tax=Culicoides brevitarsis TaxID=469753 RepID=UPI00307CB907
MNESFNYHYQSIVELTKSSSTSPSNVRNFTEDQEDIESIAKQISDHAEQIYQSWKKSGLSPTELLSCRSDSGPSFNKALSPTSQASPVAELLSQAPDLSNNNLGKLVSSFVNEDKARIAAQRRQNSPTAGGNSIAHVLQKFERSSSEPPASQRPTNLVRQSSQPPQSSSIVAPPSSSATSNGLSSNKNVPDVLKDTIDNVLPQKQKPQTPVKPEHLLNHVPSWPLKNRTSNNSNQISSSNHSESSNGVPEKSDMVKKQSSNASTGVSNSKKTSGTYGTTTPNSNKHELLDEVTREEERLINALKTGTVLNNEKVASLPEVITSHGLSDKGNMNSQPDVSSSTQPLENGQPAIKLFNGVPAKPNHTPMFNVQTFSAKDGEKPFSVNKVATARMPFRNQARDIDDIKNATAKNTPSPVRPFLSRGSVAERVLIFEKAPPEKMKTVKTVRSNSISSIKPKPEPKPQLAKLVGRQSLPNIHTTLQRHLKSSAKNAYIPQFFFPHGKPPPAIQTETTLQRLEQTFSRFDDFHVPRDKFHIIVTMCQVPLYWRVPLFMATPLSPTGAVDGNKFIDFWRRMTTFCHDSASRFVYIMSRGNMSRPWILPEDFAPLIQDVVDTHPGLAFLKEASEFHSRYVHTVISRIYYTVNRSWTGKISVAELRRSNLLDVIQLLEEEEDINQIMAYFSYEQFYVIYCKFWELDRDHDLFIDQTDLARHNDHAISTRMIERIFSGCVTRGRKTGNPCPIGPNGPRMSYTEFVWFLLAEEDKTHPTAIEYWFRCMDIDGDGILSMYELEYFYEEQQQRMESIGIETLPFEDCLCQMLDMIKPTKQGCIQLGDLKRCRMTPIFFDTFFNLEKYLEHEQRDPFATRENDELSDWDRYAAQEYELLVAEESAAETAGSYDEDEEYESNIDILESQIDDCVNEW